MPHTAWVWRLILVLTLTLALAACGLGGLPSPGPTPTLIPTMVAPTATPIPTLALVGTELLAAPGVTAACDAPPEADFVCQNASFAPSMEVNIPASTYARWSLKWSDAVDAPLTGDETLVLDLARSGAIAPNLYLVERSGDRTYASLSRFWSARDPEARLVHIPLREVLREDGSLPNFADINELQIVFEWSDMAGSLAVNSVRFEPVWVAPAAISDDARTLAAGLQVPDGFQVEPVADDLRENTQIEITPDGEMLVSLQNGRIWWYSDRDEDGVYATRRLYTTGFTEVVGLLYDPVDGAVWIGGRGQLVRTLDTDGDGAADLREVRFEGLPWGRHQNNGLDWNPDPDPFSGEPGHTWIYFGLGATGDLEVGGERNATVLRFPRDGQSADDIEVVAQGIRNAYDVVWAQVPEDLAQPDGPRIWQLFASENGPDFNDAPDEVIHVRWGRHYGFPDHFSMVEDPADEDNPFSSPVYPVVPHTSADGIAYVNHPDWPTEYRTLYVALFGEVFSPIPVGHTVERVSLQTITAPDGSVTYRGEPSDFVTGLDRPLPLTIGPDGNLLVGDYATGVIYRVSYGGAGG